MLFHDGRDLATFDSMAAQLDLIVDTADELQIAIHAIAGTVTGSEHTPTSVLKQIGQEPLCRQCGSA
jgi:hypothetical protein